MADMGQTRGAQSGEADRHAVWLAAQGLELRLSPFDPLAVLDEIERLVPSYKLDRLNLFGGNDTKTEPGFVSLAQLTGNPDLILPAHEGLFTSGVLGRHTAALVELQQFQNSEVAEAAAD
jgi:NADH-quinone oxidoreductase subunit G